MLNLYTFIKRKFAWASQNPLFWWNFFLAGATLLVVLNPGHSDFRLRLWSMALQLLGAYTVWRDLTGAAREFGHPGILQRNWSWLKAGLGVPIRLEGRASVSSSASSSGAVGQAFVALDPGAPIEQRLARLEQYIELVNDATSQAFALILSKEREVNKKIDQSVTELNQAISKTEQRLKTAMTGSYSILLFGAVWLVVGIVLAGLAPELSKLVSGEWGFCPPDSIDFIRLRHLVRN